MMSKNNLYSYLSTNTIPLTEALQTYAHVLENGIALLYSPQFCKFSKFETTGNLTDSKGERISLDYQENYIFEARVFNEDCELRWLNEFEGQGRSVLISEQELPNLSDAEASPFLETIRQQYLLWGEKTENQPVSGWQRLATARIGALDVPVSQPLTEKQRVYLNTVEYLAEVDKFGNVAVVEERLVKLEVK
jgi:CRISPR-associated protein (TIGR03984 family)